MAERRPDSLLFSLKELRRIEDDRVKQEEDDEQAKEAAAIQAKKDAEQRARDEEEAKRLAEEDRIRREHEEKERQTREGKLRVQEAERRARVEAEMQLQQQRLAMEMEAKSSHRKSLQWKLFWIVLCAAIVIGGGLGYFFYSKSQEADRLAEDKRRQEQMLEKMRKDQAEKDRIAQQEQDELNKKINNLMASLASAKDDGARELLRKQIRSQREKASQLAAARARARAAALRRAKKIRLRKTDDPLGGLGL